LLVLDADEEEFGSLLVHVNIISSATLDTIPLSKKLSNNPVAMCSSELWARIRDQESAKSDASWTKTQIGANKLASRIGGKLAFH
jgi:hypothetical protein